MNFNLDFEPNQPPPPSWPGPIALLGLALIIALIVLCTSCVSRLYDHGQLTAEIRGDYEYRKAPDGSESISLRHTPVIQSAGTATAKVVGAVGTATTAILLAP